MLTKLGTKHMWFMKCKLDNVQMRVTAFFKMKNDENTLATGAIPSVQKDIYASQPIRLKLNFARIILG